MHTIGRSFLGAETISYASDGTAAGLCEDVHLSVTNVSNAHPVYI